MPDVTYERQIQIALHKLRKDPIACAFIRRMDSLVAYTDCLFEYESYGSGWRGIVDLVREIVNFESDARGRCREYDIAEVRERMLRALCTRYGECRSIRRQYHKLTTKQRWR